MSLFRQLSLLAVYQVLGDRAESLVLFVSSNFGDHSRKVDAALRTANERAWRCLEVALAGSTWWNACQRLLTPRDEQVLRQHIEKFLAGLPQERLPADAVTFRKRALSELLSARRVGLVPGPDVSGHELADEIRAFARFTDPQKLIRQEYDAIAGMVEVLRREQYETLANYISLRPANGPPLLVQAVRFFFRREIESDEELARGLQHERLEGIDSKLDQGLDGLNQALASHGQRLEQLLGQVTELLTETHKDVRVVREQVGTTLEVVSGTRDDVRQLQEQLSHQSQQMQHLRQLLEQLLDGRTAPSVAPSVESTPTSITPMVATPAVPGSAPAAQQTESASPIGITDWAGLQQLLARARQASRSNGGTKRPDLARVAEQLAEVTDRYEKTQATLNLYRSQVLPIRPPDPPVAAVSSRKPLLSPVFTESQPATTAQESANDPAPTPPRTPKKRVLSPLFDTAQQNTGSTEPSSRDKES
jgi:uncharacterized coiled-coil protein SlyX